MTFRNATVIACIWGTLAGAAFSATPPEWECAELLESGPALLWQQLWDAIAEQTPRLSHSARARLLKESGPFAAPPAWQENWRIAPLHDALGVTRSLLSDDEAATVQTQFEKWLIQAIPAAERRGAIARRLEHSSHTIIQPEILLHYERDTGKTQFIPLPRDPAAALKENAWISLFHDTRGVWASQIKTPSAVSEDFKRSPDFGPTPQDKFSRFLEPVLGLLSRPLKKSVKETLRGSVSLDLARGVSYGEGGHSPILWDLSVKPARHQFLPLSELGTIFQDRGNAELVTAEISPDGKWVAVLTGPPHDRSKNRALIAKNFQLRIWDIKKGRYLSTEPANLLSAVVEERLELRYAEAELQWSPDSRNLLVTARDHYRQGDSVRLFGSSVTSADKYPSQGGWIFSVPAQTQTHHFPSGKFGIRSWAFHPDNQSVLFLTDTENGDLALHQVGLGADTSAFEPLSPEILKYSPQKWAQIAFGNLDGIPTVFAVTPEGALWMSTQSGWEELAQGFKVSAESRFVLPRVGKAHWIERTCELFAEFPKRGWVRWDLSFLSENCPK